MSAQSRTTPSTCEWQPIESAPKNRSIEFIGCCFDGRRMVKEPFVSFWSPTMGKFWGSPSHWMPLPPPPSQQEAGRGG